MQQTLERIPETAEQEARSADSQGDDQHAAPPRHR
jgi:hypothetical protein